MKSKIQEFQKNNFKIMSKKIICLIGFVAMLVTSCSSSDDNSTINENDVLVKRSIRTYANGGSVTTVDHTYNGRKAVKSIDSNGNYELYTYTGDLITQVRNYNSSDVLVDTETFTYNSDTKLVSYVRANVAANTGVKQTYVYNLDDTVTTATFSGDATSQVTLTGTGTIAISGGEVVMQTSSGGAMHTYTYDTKNNPFKNITGFDKIMVIGGVATGGVQHNILTDNDSSGYVYNFAYIYNTANYPMTVTRSEGTDLIFTTEYIYY
ncbi:hypothetical protein [Flavobacterium wongokense]|uniref:hypothetical protein n=1 Tax=Flavobacterium wongokense TaxID=2910674 RepID=UPI001F3843AA|nr:hypothetical protein [Flavobacterium sp. WG47]MCF6132975.1 hypothetical protein [Flavobacterium sp. WG47]